MFALKRHKLIFVLCGLFFILLTWLIIESTDCVADQKNTVKLCTNYGEIVFELYGDDAPNTVANFTKLAAADFYDGLIFHRVIKGFMIQGGDPFCTNNEGPCGGGGPGYVFADELDPSTFSYRQGYVAGVVAMANAGPDTNGSQFFIVHHDTILPHQYTIFGKVTSGFEVVDAIAGVPVDDNDMPIEPVIIKEVGFRN